MIISHLFCIRESARLFHNVIQHLFNAELRTLHFSYRHLHYETLRTFIESLAQQEQNFEKTNLLRGVTLGLANTYGHELPDLSQAYTATCRDEE